MNVIFFDGEDRANVLNGTVIRDSERLFQIVDSLRDREPFVCELRGENGFHLEIGIGELACAQYSSTDGDPPYLMAIAPHPVQGEGEIEFLMGGTPSLISNRYCMPFQSMREIVGYFFETGHAHPGFTWEGI